MKRSKKIKGKWLAGQEGFVITYGKQKRVGNVLYGNNVDKKGNLKAIVWHDKNIDGIIDRKEKIWAKYKADYVAVTYELDYPSDSGTLTLDGRSGKFKLFHDGDLFAKGQIVDMDYIF